MIRSAPNPRLLAGSSYAPNLSRHDAARRAFGARSIFSTRCEPARHRAAEDVRAVGSADLPICDLSQVVSGRRSQHLGIEFLHTNGSHNQHRIAVTKKSITRSDCFSISSTNQINTCERADQDKQTATRHVKVRDQGVEPTKDMTWADEHIGFPRDRLQVFHRQPRFPGLVPRSSRPPQFDCPQPSATQ